MGQLHGLDKPPALPRPHVVSPPLFVNLLHWMHCLLSHSRAKWMHQATIRIFFLLVSFSVTRPPSYVMN